MPDLIGCYVCHGIVDCWPECPRGTAWKRAVDRFRNETEANVWSSSPSRTF